MIDVEKMSVLIVDDMVNMCKSIRGILKVLNFGSTFRFANNGVEAWNLLKKEPVDFAVVDWNMPSMNGVELLGRIRENRDLRDMPVVMVTAEANMEMVAEAAETDIDAYILKPLTVKVFGEKVTSVIEKANNPPPMYCHLKQAREFEEAGEFKAAIEEVKNAMEAEPKSTRPIRELGYLYLKQRNLGEAEKWLTKAADMNNVDVIAFHGLGELYLERNDIDMASRYYDKAMNISPRHVTRGIKFGQVLVRKGETKKGLKVFNKAIDLTDNSLQVQEEVVDFCLENDLFEYAVKLMESVIQQTPNRYDIIYKLGVAQEKLGHRRKALDNFTKAGDNDPDNIDLQLRIAENYIALGFLLRAEKVLRPIIRKNPDDEKVLALFKQCLYRD